MVVSRGIHALILACKINFTYLVSVVYTYSERQRYPALLNEERFTRNNIMERQVIYLPSCIPACNVEVLYLLYINNFLDVKNVPAVGFL